jgi:arginase family enzyme
MTSFTFVSQNTFLRAPPLASAHRFGIAGLARDGAVTNRPGARFGTGTPEPGGLSTDQMLTVLEELADLPCVGMDCVEVAPAFDHAELTSNAAATFVWTYLAGQRRRVER